MAALVGLALIICVCVPLPSFVAHGANLEVGNLGSSSVLQALLESPYSEWVELVEQAAMLHTLEKLVGSGSRLTIFAPQNHQLQAEFKSFLLKPSNSYALKRVVQHHVLPEMVTASDWRAVSLITLASESLSLSAKDRKLYASDRVVVAPDVIVRYDGVVHGVGEMLIPNSILQDFVAYTTSSMETPLPTGAPGLDSRRAQLLEKQYTTMERKVPLYNIHIASPLPSLPPATAPSIAPAPGPGPSGAPWLDIGEDEVTAFIQALLRFEGYSEFANLLTDLTSMAAEITKLVNSGAKLTILAPDDHAWKNALTEEQLSSQTALEEILHFHIITEYQTEESLYSTLRRMGKSHFSTLRVPRKLAAREVDGQVVFGDGDNVAGVFDHDIFSDGRLSVQGIDKVLVPEEQDTEPPPAPKFTVKNARKLSNSFFGDSQ